MSVRPAPPSRRGACSASSHLDDSGALGRRGYPPDEHRARRDPACARVPSLRALAGPVSRDTRARRVAADFERARETECARAGPRVGTHPASMPPPAAAAAAPPRFAFVFALFALPSGGASSPISSRPRPQPPPVVSRAIENSLARVARADRRSGTSGRRRGGDGPHPGVDGGEAPGRPQPGVAPRGAQRLRVASGSGVRAPYCWTYVTRTRRCASAEADREGAS